MFLRFASLSCLSRSAVYSPADDKWDAISLPRLLRCAAADCASMLPPSSPWTSDSPSRPLRFLILLAVPSASSSSANDSLFPPLPPPTPTPRRFLGGTPARRAKAAAITSAPCVSNSSAAPSSSSDSDLALLLMPVLTLLSLLGAMLPVTGTHALPQDISSPTFLENEREKKKKRVLVVRGAEESRLTGRLRDARECQEKGEATEGRRTERERERERAHGGREG